MDKTEIILAFGKLREIEKHSETSTAQYKVRAYTNAINDLKAFPNKLVKLEDVPKLGMGDKLKSKVNEMIATGKISQLEQLMKKKKPKAILTFPNILGFGPKFVNELFSRKIYTLTQLQKSRIKLTDTQLIGIKYNKDLSRLIPRSVVKPSIFKITGFDVMLCGSYRRGKEKMGDLDVLVIPDKLVPTSYTKNISAYLVVLVKKLKVPYVLVSRGPTKIIILLKLDKYYRHVDIRFIEPKSKIPAMIYFTGSIEFNIKMRSTAKKLGYKLNEYSLTNLKTVKTVKLKTEKGLFKKLNMTYLRPKDR